VLFDWDPTTVVVDGNGAGFLVDSDLDLVHCWVTLLVVGSVDCVKRSGWGREGSVEGVLREC
jgi:hypothetical protein